MQKNTRRNAISNKKKSMLSVSTAYCMAWIRMQSHFTADQLRNSWQMLAELLGSAETWLKITEPEVCL